MRILQKAFIITALLVSMAVGLTVYGAISDTGFSDVDRDDWYAEAVAYCVENNIMSGTSETVFSPDNDMTRPMLAMVLYNMEGSPVVSQANIFSDVENGAWYQNAVLWAYQEGIISGYDDGSFGVDDSISREQLAAVLWRYAGSPSVEGEIEFSDSNNISAYALEAVNWSEENNIISGDENLFMPRSNATRAQAASALMNCSLYRNSIEIQSEQEYDSDNSENDVLVAYFSRTGNTESVAQIIQENMNADLFEIIPEEPYPSDYQECLERAEQEQNENARPAIANSLENMDEYDVIFLGFPIWYGDTPMIIQTFLEEYDFDGKVIAPFSTSGSSGIGTAVNSINQLSGADVRDGLSITGGNIENAENLVLDWLEAIDISPAGVNLPQNGNENGRENSVIISINGDTFIAELENNVTTEDFITMLPFSQTFSDYNNTEKISYLSRELETESQRESYEPKAGDLCYYVPWGNLCFFYEDFRASSDLVPIAHLTDGIGEFAGIADATEITIDNAS